MVIKPRVRLLTRFGRWGGGQGKKRKRMLSAHRHRSDDNARACVCVCGSYAPGGCCCCYSTVDFVLGGTGKIKTSSPISMYRYDLTVYEHNTRIMRSISCVCMYTQWPNCTPVRNTVREFSDRSADGPPPAAPFESRLGNFTAYSALVRSRNTNTVPPSENSSNNSSPS